MMTGGEGEIRTHGTREGTTVFETVPIDHSGTSPRDARYSIRKTKSKRWRSQAEKPFRAWNEGPWHRLGARHGRTGMVLMSAKQSVL